MRKAAFVLAFLIFSIPAIVEAPYTPIWNATMYSSLIELKTMSITGKRKVGLFRYDLQAVLARRGIITQVY